jgi:hypothetical protein
VSKKRKHIIAPPFITILQRTIVKINYFHFGNNSKKPHAQKFADREREASGKKKSIKKLFFLYPFYQEMR